MQRAFCQARYKVRVPRVVARQAYPLLSCGGNENALATLASSQNIPRGGYVLCNITVISKFALPMAVWVAKTGKTLRFSNLRRKHLHPLIETTGASLEATLVALNHL